MFVVAAGLLGLIVVLATLQYRWLGQISEAERDRMSATLRTNASSFAEDFDRELNRAYLLFQVAPIGPDESAPKRVTARPGHVEAAQVHAVPVEGRPRERVPEHDLDNDREHPRRQRR